ncbi:MAG: S9 family peptidase [Caulobacteraceae bacterium]|nr:S9 family peptidase [Caulobacteraceae bacterium]
MRWFPALLIAALVLASPFPAPAQIVSPNAPLDPAAQARLELSGRFLRMPLLLRDSLVMPRWLADHDRLVFWDEIGPQAGTWVLVDARSGRRKPILPPVELRRQLSELTGEPVAALSQMQFVVAPDQGAILFSYKKRALRLGLADRRVRAAAGLDAFVLSGGTSAPTPGATLGAMARDGGFVVRDATGRVLVERSGEPNYDWTIPDKAWSPDGARLVVWRTDERAVHRIPIVDYESGLERVTMVPYAKTGTPLAKSELYLVQPKTGGVVRVAPAQDEGYDWFAGWRADGRTAFVLHLSRDGKRLDLSIIDGLGERRLLLREERAETNVGDLDFITEGWPLQVTPLEDGGFLWMSERDGWRHVYHYDGGGRLIGQITHGDFPVRRVNGVGPGGALLVTASIDPARPYDEQLYRTSLAGGPLQPLGEARGLHRATVAPSGRFVLDTWSSPTQPRIREMVRADGGDRLRLTASDDTAVKAIGWRPPEPLEVLAADGVTPIYGAVFKPRDFDPAKRYPVLAYIYGGPFATVLGGGYFTAMSLRMSGLAQMGFVVVAFDVRGSSGRSKAFQDATYGKVGQTEIPDYVAGLRQIAASRPWLDMDRVGIVGHSWGGYFALRGMLTAPDVFKAGYAGAPGALEEDAAVNEPDMGLLADNPSGYAAASNTALAGNLRGSLKIMHGTSDTSASLSTTMRMADALIKADKRFELLLIPGMEHNSDGPDGLYYHQDVALFFRRTLGEPR